jgi:octopine/nopaline transport system substrate-binding protein
LNYHQLLKLLLASALLSVSFTAQADEPKKKITIATEGAFRPWNYYEGGELKGLDIDLAHEVCARANFDCEIIAHNWDGLIPSLNLGKFDAIIASLNATAEREKAIAFSIPYSNDGNLFATLKGSDLEKLPFTGDVISLNDQEKTDQAVAQLTPLLKGKIIGVQTGSNNAAVLRKYFSDAVEIREYKSVEEHDLDLQSGRVDAVMAAYGSLVESMRRKPEIVTAGPRFNGGIVGNGASIGIRKDDAELKQAFDTALASLFEDGTMTKISMKWLGYDTTPQQ